jgi:hypothetical protein
MVISLILRVGKGRKSEFRQAAFALYIVKVLLPGNEPHDSDRVDRLGTVRADIDHDGAVSVFDADFGKVGQGGQTGPAGIPAVIVVGVSDIAGSESGFFMGIHSVTSKWFSLHKYKEYNRK